MTPDEMRLVEFLLRREEDQALEGFLYGLVATLSEHPLLAQIFNALDALPAPNNVLLQELITAILSNDRLFNAERHDKDLYSTFVAIYGERAGSKMGKALFHEIVGANSVNRRLRDGLGMVLPETPAWYEAWRRVDREIAVEIGSIFLALLEAWRQRPKS
jgi:hypothetical protein